MNFKELLKSLEVKIQGAYAEGVTPGNAESLAGEFLYAQMLVSSELKKSDLDSRMRKTGVKALRSAIYLDIVQKSDKKPTESHIEATINTDEMVTGEQNAYDSAEVDKAELERYFGIFQNAHIFFRGVAKGKFE